MAGNFRGHTFNAMMQPRAVDDRPLTFRGAIAPLGTYANPDGTEEAGLAWPGMITEPLNALQRLHENSYTEDGRPGIPNPQHPENLEDASTLLWSIYGGNALNPAAAIPKNAVGMFAGRRAKTADHNALAQAEKMAAEGVSRDDIWNQTGWFQGADDKWRFEIDDRGLKVKEGYGEQLGSKWLSASPVTHKALQAAYPKNRTMDIAVEEAPFKGGSYNEASNSLTIAGRPDEWRDVTAHELQHYIQGLEGFARGSNPDYMTGRMSKAGVNDMGSSGFNAYHNQAGEVEARNVAKRLNMTQEQRRAIPPWMSQDVTDDDLVFNGANLFSDTGKPSLTGSAISSAGHDVSGSGAVTKPKGITAYHGSPHDFNKFDLSKIGTGEGAQAYGHGLYFAENEGVAKSYRDLLGDYSGAVKWKGEQPPTPMQQSLLNQLGGADVQSGTAMDVPRLKRELSLMLREAEHGMFPNEKRAAEYSAQLAELRRIEHLIETKPPGRMYQVRINADPNDFLDWDLPLGQQNEKVRNAISQAAYGETLPEWTGADAYHSVGSQMFSEPDIMSPEISHRVREAGIPGIRYLDQMSRTAGDGSRNYVVFDDSLIEILKKYGLAGGAIGAGSLFDFNTEQRY